MNDSENELRWDAIQRTRERDRTTGEPKPGSPGMAYVRWHNGMLDRVLVLARDIHYNVEVQRIIGGQRQKVKLGTIRTEGEILAFLKRRFPQHLPAARGKNGAPAPAFNPQTLPRTVIDEAWGVK